MCDMNLEREIAKLFPALEIILPQNILTVLRAAKPDEICLLQFGLNMFIRNHLLLPTAALYHTFVRAGIPHKDDMSVMILDLFCVHLDRNK